MAVENLAKLHYCLINCSSCAIVGIVLHNISILFFRWNKLIQRPYENGDPRGLKLIKAILRPLMLRRTKDTKDKAGR